MNRRQFLVSLSAAMSMPIVRPATADNRSLPLAFSTLGCPRWDWETILKHAQEWGYAAVELRGLQGEMDLTKRPEFAGQRLATTLELLQDHHLKISDLGSSVRLHESDPRARAAQLAEGKSYIQLAHRLGVPFIRVFGDRIGSAGDKQATIDRICQGLGELGDYAKGSGVGVLIESHGDFCDSPTLQTIFSQVNRANVALLWDAHHTVVAGKEKPATTWQNVGRYVRHVHLKDSKPGEKDVRYVLTGQGTIPLREIIQLLADHSYPGYYSFEWEKVWHPEIEEPEVAFPQFAAAVRAYGISPKG